MSKRSEASTKDAPGATPSKPGRKRGAQPGNLNAFKHGFYASTYTAEEIKGLVDPAKIRAEQDMLRTKALRLAKLTPLKKVTTQELQTLARLLATVARIDALERTLLLARRKPGDPDDGLFEALAKMDPYDL
jgi:hypothetical protein